MMARLAPRCLCVPLAAWLLSSGPGCRTPVPAPAPAPAPREREVRVAAPLTVLGGAFDATGLLGRDGAIAEAMGATALQVLATGAATDGDRVGGFVALRRDVCLLAFARATGSIDDLDIVAFDDEGAPIAADQAVDPKPAVVVCPPHPNRVYVAGRVASGHGFVAVGVQSVMPVLAPAVAQMFGARVAGRDGAIAQAWPGLDVVLDRRRRALGGRWEELRRAVVPVSPRAPTYVSAALGAGRCLDALVVSSEDTANLEVTMSDAAGREIARAASVGKDRAMLACSPIDATLTVAVRPHDGHGSAAVVLSRSAPGAQAELTSRPDTIRLAPTESLERVRARAAAALAKLGYEPSRELATGRVEAARSTLLAVELAAGCTRLDVFAGEPVAGVRAALWDDKDELLSRAEGGEQATVYGCTATARRAQIELRAVGRPGPFAVEIRREKAPPPELMHHPLASSRLLQRANGVRAVSVPDLAEVRRVDLDETRRARFEITVPVKMCSNVVVATEAGAVGLTLSAIEVGSDVEVADARGGNVALLRACVTTRPLKLRVHAQLDAGKAEGVAAVFVTPIEGATGPSR